MEFRVEIQHDTKTVSTSIALEAPLEHEEYYFTLYLDDKPLRSSGWIKENHYSFPFYDSGKYQVQGHVRFDDKNLWKRSEFVHVSVNKNENKNKIITFNPIQKTLRDFMSDDEIYRQQIHVKESYDSYFIEAFLFLREKSEGNIVMFPAVQRPDSVKNPIFHRWSWFKQFPNYNFICVSDPSLYLYDVPGGWFLSGEGEDLILQISNFLESILKKINSSASDSVFYGSSMGGFGAMMAASEMRGASVLAEVPQTDLRNYSIKSAIKMIEDEIFSGIKLVDLDPKMNKMISVADRFLQNSTVPEIHLVTNPTDEGFEQCIDFIKNTVSISRDVEYRGNVKLEILPENLGHNPMHSSELIPRIHKVFVQS